jgi:hypothetical protein
MFSLLINKLKLWARRSYRDCSDVGRDTRKSHHRCAIINFIINILLACHPRFSLHNWNLDLLRVMTLCSAPPAILADRILPKHGWIARESRQSAVLNELSPLLVSIPARDCADQSQGLNRVCAYGAVSLADDLI